PTVAIPTPTAVAVTLPPASDGPELHTQPDLEAPLPDSVGGGPLDRTSPSIAAELEADPRAASALALLRLVGRTASDIHFARAIDETDPNRFTMTAFQIPGLDARVFGGAIVNVVTNAIPGAQT